MDNQWKDSIKSESFWLRSVFMVLFFVVYRIVDILVLLVAISQWLYVLLSGDANQGLRKFANGLSLYVAQIINYLSYNTEEKPYPFSDWPEKVAPVKTSRRKTTRKVVKKTSAKAEKPEDQGDA
ncbi:hypothetical protein NBRC116188_20960 [Oceaniserpentilla sp. 4NH20-0058]|uniref:DUF4389 domain-containing protein n=1 Tax=Oceaniserpentilla sp. 4NH20-0058 TaxID=3127660 RepID=UPI003104D8D4